MTIYITCFNRFMLRYAGSPNVEKDVAESNKNYSNLRRKATPKEEYTGGE